MAESRIDSSLTMSKVRLNVPENVGKAIRALEATWETPDGWPLTDPMAVWRHTRELLMGFYYRWEPRPPKPWIEARREWGKFVRDVLSHSHKLDSELQVARAYPDAPELLEWRAIKDTFEPNSVPSWLNEYVIDYAERWMAEPGIVWVEHNAVGVKLSERTGRRFYAQIPGIEQDSGAVIASIPSNGEGKNLQKWNRNLILSVPPNGSILEQLLGRTHRDGQEADEVTADFLICGQQHEEALSKAIFDAKYIQQSTGQEQKILYGDWT